MAKHQCASFLRRCCLGQMYSNCACCWCYQLCYCFEITKKTPVFFFFHCPLSVSGVFSVFPQLIKAGHVKTTSLSLPFLSLSRWLCRNSAGLALVPLPLPLSGLINDTGWDMNHLNVLFWLHRHKNVWRCHVSNFASRAALKNAD